MTSAEERESFKVKDAKGSGIVILLEKDLQELIRKGGPF